MAITQISIILDNVPGALSNVSEILGRVSGQAIVILGVDRTEDAQKVLEQNWVRTLGKEVYNI